VRQASRARRDSARLSTREGILAAAGELLVEGGTAALTLRRVAERVGYTATTIYRHFADKDALLYAITDETFQTFISRLRAAADTARDARTRLEAMALAYIEFGLEHPVHYRILFLERPDLLWRRDADRAGSRIESLGVFRSAVDDVLGAAGHAAPDGLAVSNALWALTHGTVALALAIPHMPPRQARAFGTLGVRALVSGLTSA
jgi:AcrR family transcriptional regulator